MEKRIVVPRIVVRPLLPPPLEIGARIRPQWLHWQVGRYRDKLSFGPGGEGRAKVWVPEREGEQHNLILTQFYDSLIPQYGFVAPSMYAAVGTGSTTPEPTQTQLANEIGSASAPKRTNNVPTGESSAIEALATHGEYNIRRVFEFTETQVGGLNLTEWGFSPVNTRNGPLMTRELFRDGLGNPVVLTLATDQRLRLIYRYKVTVSPTTPQAVSVNIGGDGPGIRTAQFVLTGRVLPTGIYMDAQMINGSAPSDRGGDLIIVDVLAQAGTEGGVGQAGVSAYAAPLTYIHTTDYMNVADPKKYLSYNAPVGRSRTASLLFQSGEALVKIRSVILNANMGSASDPRITPGGNLVFDAGQEFTKDNLHKLLIANWQVTWGP